MYFVYYKSNRLNKLPNWMIYNVFSKTFFPFVFSHTILKKDKVIMKRMRIKCWKMKNEIVLEMITSRKLKMMKCHGHVIWVTVGYYV